MSSYKIKYSVWKKRVLPILERSGWELMENEGATYFVHQASKSLFEFRYYGDSSPVNVGEIEKYD
jgi:hypothetical protein